MKKEINEKMNKVIEHLDSELAKVRTSRANAGMLDGVLVEAYGNKMPLNQVALITIPEARQIMVKPFDPSTLKDVEKAILDANLGFNPSNDGEFLRINIPMLTEETRKDIVKSVKKIGEDNKVALRNIRKDIKEKIKKDSELTEDMKKSAETDLQAIIDDFNKKIDSKIDEKEKEILTI